VGDELVAIYRRERDDLESKILRFRFSNEPTDASESFKFLSNDLMTVIIERLKNDFENGYVVLKESPTGYKVVLET